MPSITSKTGIFLIFLFFVCQGYSSAKIYEFDNAHPGKGIVKLGLLQGDLEPTQCTITSVNNIERRRVLSTEANAQDIAVRRYKPSGFVEITAFDSEEIWSTIEALCPAGIRNLEHISMRSSFLHDQAHFEAPPLALEIFPLLVSGSSENRVDWMFFGDGYTSDEKEKFLTDAKRLAADMSQNQTFATVRPLVNFWAAFTPSEESGVGVGGAQKNTAFGLYRDGTELRALYPGKPEIARQACASQGLKCNYPVLIGNDPYYGGLGGEFVISTASEVNGALVLRHELGHSVIEVGEEYDGGFAYFGVNSSPDPGEEYAISWSHWLSSPATPRTERAIMPFQDYAWTMLNKTSPWSATFESSGLYARHLVRFSLSGLPNTKDLKVYLDGKDLGWKPRLDLGLDRWHYDIFRDTALEAGVHELKFELGESAQEGKAQLCSAEIIEYGDETEFNSTLGNYGAYPTFSITNTTTYRPTNEQCIMRIVTSTNFCSVCKEGLWMSLLKRVSLLDGISISTGSEEYVKLRLRLLPFGQFRADQAERLPGEEYSIQWWKEDKDMPQFANETTIRVDENIYGNWSVFIQLHTPEVRADLYGLLHAQARVELLPGNLQPHVNFV